MKITWSYIGNYYGHDCRHLMTYFRLDMVNYSRQQDSNILFSSLRVVR